MFTLYWERMAGSIVVQATLEALNADYRMQYIDMGAGEHLDDDFLRISPAGRIPALRLPDGTTMGETAAIVILLGELHPANRVTPQPGEADRGAFLYWLSVMATAGYVTSSRVGHPERFAREDGAIAQVKAQADKDYADFFRLMETAITGAPYFLPRGLTALDFYLTMLSEWIGDREAAFEGLPRLSRLCNEVGGTPEYGTALRTHSLTAVSPAH